MKDDNYLWTGIHFMGGISGDNRGTCGAISGAAICLGLRHRCSLAPENKVQSKAARNTSRAQAGTLTKDFADKFGHVACKELLQIDFSVPGAYQEFRSSGVAEKKCYQYIYFLIDKLYSFEENE